MGGLLKALLKRGADPCAPAHAPTEGQAYWTGWHPIHFAASRNQGAAAEAVHILVAAGESPSVAAGEEGIQPLHTVMDNADAETAGEVTQVLLELGADVNGRRAAGRTPLMEACSFAQSAAVAEAVMKPLLNAGADVNAADEGGWTACAYAATNPSQEAAVAALRLLAAHSADMNRPAKDGRTALSIAACQLEWRNLPVVLACGADPNSADRLGMTALHYACTRAATAENVSVAIRALLDAGADVSKRDGQGRLPIHLAAMHKNGEVAVAAIRLLAQAPGFDANARRSKEEQGATALHTAALRRTDGGSATTAIIEALLAAGADVNALNDEGWCALEDAYVNPYPPGEAAARALWAAGGRFFMPDPKTGEWLGPDSLDDVVDPARRRARSSAMRALSEIGPDSAASMLAELKALVEEAKKRGEYPEDMPDPTVDLASYLRARFGRPSGDGPSASGQQQQGPKK